MALGEKQPSQRGQGLAGPEFQCRWFRKFWFRYVRIHVPLCEASVRLSRRKYRALPGLLGRREAGDGISK